MKKFILALIRLYQRSVSPYTPSRCRSYLFRLRVPSNSKIWGRQGHVAGAAPAASVPSLL